MKKWLYGSSGMYMPSKEHISQDKATAIAFVRHSGESQLTAILLFLQVALQYGWETESICLDDNHACGWKKKYVAYVSAVDGSVIDLIEVGHWG